MKRASNLRVYLGGLAAAGGLFLAAPALADASLATAVKMTYLYKFAPFISWPAGANDPTRFTICIVGSDPFGRNLDAAVADLSYGDRPYAVARIDAIGPQSKCDIAYLGGSSKQTIPTALQAVKGSPTVTITDEESQPGIITFKMQAGKVRFRIDQVAAAVNGVTISSKLLSLAVSVKTPQGVIEP